MTYRLVSIAWCARLDSRRHGRGGDSAEVCVEIDEEALELAAEALGTTTPSDTVNTALRETTDQVRRAGGAG
ncbi:hypothetical protein [Allonocardiopsis opalescens]|uniref:hypothetical protein n=1 Tax=Allonocardiopsis opalescens TaxID=1144618 RepID=UPI001B80B1CF|nr:hypothetical protein [Allonocardiopsis opalescens]